MKRLLTKSLLLVIGMILLVLALAPAIAPTAYAIPLAALSPSPEPPSATPLPPSATPLPPSATPLPPSATLPPTDTPGSTDTPTRKPETRHADPAVTKAASVSEARIGDIVDFTLTVTNYGGETADDVVVTDALPDFLDVVEANASKGAVAVSGRTVVVTIGPVAPGEVITIRIRARVNDLAQPPGGRNSVTLTTSSNSDDPTNDIDSVAIAIPLVAASATLPPTEPPEATPAGPLQASPDVAETASVAGAPGATTRRLRLPRTAAVEEPIGSAWPLALLGLAAIGLSMVVHLGGSVKE